jgi:hypothetical protein
MKRPRKSPTQLSLEHLASQGVRADIVERRCGAFVTKDLFGFIDILGVDQLGKTIAVQTTTAGHMANRIAKIEHPDNHAALVDVRRAGWRLYVHGWRWSKRKGKHVLRERDLS